jgi:transcriptional regulator with XRE-family HTH domain
MHTLRVDIRCANDARMTSVRNLRLVIGDARRALHMTQADFAGAVQGSHRSVVRWEGGQSIPAAHHLTNLATLLHPVDRDLAAEAALHAGATLESLGLEVPPPPPAPPAPPPPPQAALPPAPPPRPRPKPGDLVDVLVFAGTLETGASAAEVRRWLHVVIKRACDVGLTMEEAEEGLRPAVLPAAKTP